MQVAQKHETVSSAELTRNFAYWQDRAARGPVTITYHGRPRYVLASADAWEASHDTALPPPEEAGRDLEYQFLVEHMDGGLVILDSELRICEASTAAALIVGRTAGAISGMAISEAVPAFSLGSATADLRLVLKTGEQAQFDLALDPRNHTRLRVRAFPWVEGVALLLRVYYEGDEEARLAEQTAFETARAAHGGIELLRLTVRGTVALAEPEFARMVGLPRERILGLRFVDLLAGPNRMRARDAIERVLGGHAEAEAFDACLLADGAVEVPVRIALAPLADGFSVGGAIVIVTRV